MSAGRDPDFYVGYRPEAPTGLARFLRPRIAGLYLLAVLIAMLLVVSQGRFATAFFEFGTLRSFEGVVAASPYPRLLVLRPASAKAESPFSSYYLSGSGKHGAQSEVAGLDGRLVRLRGTLVYREDQTLIELAAGSIEPLEDAARERDAVQVPRMTSLGRYTLRGEIVDSKCYLGVMKPGDLKPHRACAVRCISGGIPPLFVVRDEQGNGVYLMLVGADGRSLSKEVLDRVAEPLEIEGEVLREGSLLVLRADPARYRRLL